MECHLTTPKKGRSWKASSMHMWLGCVHFHRHATSVNASENCLSMTGLCWGSKTHKQENEYITSEDSLGMKTSEDVNQIGENLLWLEFTHLRKGNVQHGGTNAANVKEEITLQSSARNLERSAYDG